MSSSNVVSVDYAYMKKKVKLRSDGCEELGGEADGEERREQEKGSCGLPMLVLHHRRSNYITANMVPQKGAHPYVVKRLKNELEKLIGDRQIVINSDQEAAIRSLKEVVTHESVIDIETGIQSGGIAEHCTSGRRCEKDRRAHHSQH